MMTLLKGAYPLYHHHEASEIRLMAHVGGETCIEVFFFLKFTLSVNAMLATRTHQMQCSHCI